VAVLTSARGKKTMKGKIFLAMTPSYRRRREKGPGWAPWISDGRRRRARIGGKWRALVSPILGR
jgi:hypothetical protein